MARIVSERGRAKQQKDQDSPHHHRRPTPFPSKPTPRGARDRSSLRERTYVHDSHLCELISSRSVQRNSPEAILIGRRKQPEAIHC